MDNDRNVKQWNRMEVNGKKVLERKFIHNKTTFNNKKNFAVSSFSLLCQKHFIWPLKQFRIHSLFSAYLASFKLLIDLSDKHIFLFFFSALLWRVALCGCTENGKRWKKVLNQLELFKLSLMGWVLKFNWWTLNQVSIKLKKTLNKFDDYQLNDNLK